MKKWELKPGDKVRVRNWLSDNSKASDGLIFLKQMSCEKELTVESISSNGNFKVKEQVPSFFYSPEFVYRSYNPGDKFTVRTDLHEGDLCDGGYFLNEMRSPEPLELIEYNKANSMLMSNYLYYTPEMLIPWIVHF